MIILNIPTNYIAWCCQTGTWSVLQLNTTDLSPPTQLDCIRRGWMALLSKGHLEQKLRCLFLGKIVVPLGWRAPSGLTLLLEPFKRGWLLRAPEFSPLNSACFPGMRFSIISTDTFTRQGVWAPGWVKDRCSGKEKSWTSRTFAPWYWRICLCMAVIYSIKHYQTAKTSWHLYEFGTSM